MADVYTLLVEVDGMMVVDWGLFAIDALGYEAHGYWGAIGRLQPRGPQQSSLVEVEYRSCFGDLSKPIWNRLPIAKYGVVLERKWLLGAQLISAASERISREPRGGNTSKFPYFPGEVWDVCAKCMTVEVLSRTSRANLLAVHCVVLRLHVGRWVLLIELA